MKHKLFFGLFLFSFFTFTNKSFSQKGNVLVKGTDEYKIFQARQSFVGNNFMDALDGYKEVLKNRPNDPSITYAVGECYFMMREYSDALENFEKARSLKSDVNSEIGLMLGRTYHYKGMLDKALKELTTYRQTISDSKKNLEASEVDLYIAQVNVAKKLMANPVNVKLTDLIDLNSQYDDKSPVLFSDEKELLFTSRRPAGNKSRVDEESDFGFFDDIYHSIWNEEKQTWSQAEIMKGAINTPEHDASTGISFDGNTFFIYRNGPSLPGAGELYTATRNKNGKWKVPELLPKPINSTYYEDAACLSPDGKTLYFVSERPGGLGKADIYTSQKVGDGWSDPVNLGTPVNTSYDENGIFLCADGRTLFFCSNGSTSMGQYDIFRTVKGTDGRWSIPVNIGYPINSVLSETKFILTKDKKTAYISTTRDSGIGERDIYMVDLTYYDPMTGEAISPIIPKSTVNGVVKSDDGTALSAEVKIVDKSSGSVVTMLKTNSDGTYSIELPANKHYTIEVTSEGFQKASIDISLSPQKNELNNFTMVKNN